MKNSERSGLRTLAVVCALLLPLLSGCGKGKEGKEGKVPPPTGNEPAAAGKPADAASPALTPATAGSAAAAGGEVFASKVGPEKSGKPTTLREAYPDYQPGKDDPEIESTKTGRRKVERHDLALSEGGAGNLKALLEQAVVAVDAGDSKAAQRLCVTRQDFTSILWPEMPQSRPAAGVPEGEAWDFLYNRNMAAFNRNMGDFHGTGLRLTSFKVGKTVEYTNYRLLDEITIEAEQADHQPITLDMVRTVVERKGTFKIYSTRD